MPTVGSIIVISLNKGDNMTNLSIRAIDIPTIHKFGIGFDSILDELLRTTSQQTTYPPYNVIKLNDDHFTIELAVAGFKEGEIDLSVERNMLTITGVNETHGESVSREYLHRGISARNFTRTFTLAEHVKVEGAIMRDGILAVDLIRIIPEDQKPKSIAITYTK